MKASPPLLLLTWLICYPLVQGFVVKKEALAKPGQFPGRGVITENAFQSRSLAVANTGTTIRVSIDSNGAQGNLSAMEPSISADGRDIAFMSEANNLVSGDTNGQADIFVHDRVTGQTTRVSVASDGMQANHQSFGGPVSISAYGRYVTFTSEASNLVSGDTNDLYDVFVHDRETGQTTRASVASDGTPGNLASYAPSISRDGRYVAFGSEADNLVSGDLNGRGDVFVHDRVTGQTDRVSLASDGTEANHLSSEASISAGGRYVAFFSSASNLVSDDTNGAWDVFVHDRQTGETTRVSVAFGGSQGNAESRLPSISADGRFLAFASNASNLVSDDTNGTWDVFVHDRMGVVYQYLPMIINAYPSSQSTTVTPTATNSPVPTYTPAPTGTATAAPADTLTPTAMPDVTATETVQPTFTRTPTGTSTPPPVALGHESWMETPTPTELPPRLAPGQPVTISYIDMIDAFSGWAIGGRTWVQISPVIAGRDG